MNSYASDVVSGTGTWQADPLIRQLFGSAHMGPGGTLVLPGPGIVRWKHRWVKLSKAAEQSEVLECHR
jgi:hypothetical protein